MNASEKIDNTDRNKLRLIILQRVCPAYRIPLFQQLGALNDIDMTLFIGEDLPNSKVKSAPNLSSFNVYKFKTIFVGAGSRIFPFHLGLINKLRISKPDVILCEGESNFLGYLQAIFYRIFFNNRVALMHWCFISLPGQSNKGRKVRVIVKGFFRKFFDAFVVYSTFSKTILLKLGEPSEKIFVATNVGDTPKYLALSDSIIETKSEARKTLGLEERFTVLYLGTLDKVKRPEIMLDLAKICDQRSYNFVLLGSGSQLDELRNRKLTEKLSNVSLPGRVIDQLPLYLRASDVLLVPGRGGIVFSEAMALGLPVVVHEADGTEYDLVEDGITGIHLKGGEIEDFFAALEFLRNNPTRCKEMGNISRQRAYSIYTVENMVEQIKRAAYFAKDHRNR